MNVPRLYLNLMWQVDVKAEKDLNLKFIILKYAKHI